jgi:hypothetical protein
MPRRSDETQPKALQVVKRVIERMDFQLAPVTRACIDFANGKAAAEPASRCAVQIARKPAQRRLIEGRRRFGQPLSEQILQEYAAHDWS